MWPFVLEPIVTALVINAVKLSGVLVAANYCAVPRSIPVKFHFDSADGGPSVRSYWLVLVQCQYKVCIDRCVGRLCARARPVGAVRLCV